MVQQDSNTEEIIGLLSKQFLSGYQVAELLNHPKEFPTALIEKLSLETAFRYWNRQINYEDGDCIMNNIYAFWIANDYYINYGFGEVAWECYNAFDEGENSREDDEEDTDPAEKYTRPHIEELLKKRNLLA